MKFILTDLPDERRAAKTAKLGTAASDLDVTEGRVVMRQFSYAPFIGFNDTEPVRMKYPACREHGAMLKLSVREDIWRCGECGVGCRFTMERG